MPTHLIRLDLITQILFGEKHRSLSSSPHRLFYYPAISALLGPQYLPQHPILKHPQPKHSKEMPKY